MSDFTFWSRLFGEWQEPVFAAARGECQRP